MNTPVKQSPVVFCPAPGDTVCNAEGYSAEYVGPFDFGHVVRPIFENRDDDGAPLDIVSTVPVIWTDVFPGDACPKMAAEIEEQRAILVALRKQVQEARQDMSSTQSARAEIITELVVQRDKLKAENDRLRELLAEKVVSSTMLTGLEVNRGGIDVGFDGGAAQMLAEMFIEQFNVSGAINSLEVTFQDKELGQIVVTTQRMGGLTPAQQRGKAIAERDALLSIVVKIVTETMDYPPVKPTSADSWIPRELVSEAQSAITAVRGYPVPTHPTYRPAE